VRLHQIRVIRVIRARECAALAAHER
jgi:hypothetical protein